MIAHATDWLSEAASVVAFSIASLAMAVTRLALGGCCCGVGCKCACCGDATICEKAPRQIILTVTGVITGDGTDPIWEPFRDCATSACSCDCESFNGAFICEFRYKWDPVALDCEWWTGELYFCTFDPRGTPAAVRTDYSIRLSGPIDPGSNGPTCWSGYDGSGYSCGYLVQGTMGHPASYVENYYSGGPTCGNGQFLDGYRVFPTHDNPHSIPNACLLYDGEMDFYGFYWAAPAEPPLGECCLFLDDLGVVDAEDQYCPSDADAIFSIALVGSENAPCLNCDDLTAQEKTDCDC